MSASSPRPESPTDPLGWHHVRHLQSFADGGRFDIHRRDRNEQDQRDKNSRRSQDSQYDQEILVHNHRSQQRVSWHLKTDAGTATLHPQWPAAAPLTAPDILAALEGAFTFFPQYRQLTLPPGPWPDTLRQRQILVPGADGSHIVHRDMLWQLPELWLPVNKGPIPLSYRLSHGRQHPLRPPKPQGLLYRRHIPWLGRTLSFRALDINADLERFHRWMNEPQVARIWQEQGSLDQHRQYLHTLEKDPHIHPMIVCLDDEPFGYFEVYWAKEDRIAPFYDADDHDRGWHVLIGEPAYRGKAIAVAWFTAISHYLFLDDPRTRRIVGEPRADHIQQIRNLDRSGYAKLKTFDFPHKRALLVMLLRERFFDDALWWPAAEAPSPQEPGR